MIKARKYLDKPILRTLHFTFIYPYYTYCNQIWGSTYVSNLNKLIVLQKKIMRIICQVKPRTHTDPLFKHLGIIKVVDINKYLTGKFMFRWCNGLMPQIFDNFLCTLMFTSTTRDSKFFLKFPLSESTWGKCLYALKEPLSGTHLGNWAYYPLCQSLCFQRNLR